MSFINKTSTGSWKAFWRDPEGRQRSKTLPTKREARQFLADLDARKGRGEYVSPHAGKTLFAEHAKLWMETRRTEITTSERDESYMRNHVLVQWSRWKLCDITEMEVQKWVTALAERRSRALVSKCLDLTSGVMKSAIRNRLIGVNPCKGVIVPQVRERDTDERIIERDAFRDVLLPEVPEKYRALVAMAGGTGLRWGELIGLRADALELDARKLTVMRTVVEVGGTPSYKSYPKSVAGRRTVPVPSWAMQELREHLSRTRRGEHGLVFPNEVGRPLRRSLFRNRVWRPALVRAGLLGQVVPLPSGQFEARWTDSEHHVQTEQHRRYNDALRCVVNRCAFGLRFHDLRHSYGTWLADDGLPPNKLQRVMGHEDVTTTMKLYVRKTEDHDAILGLLDDGGTDGDD